MATKDHVIDIEINDWVQEFNTEEIQMTSVEDIIEQAMAGQGPMKVSRMALTARHLGIAPVDIMASDKLLLNQGGATSISLLIARRHKRATLANGNTVEVREYVGSVREDEEEDHELDENHTRDVKSLVPADVTDDDISLVKVEDKRARDRALMYLERRIVPSIRERMKIIAIHDPKTVKQVVKELKKQIDLAVADLV